MPTHHVIIHTKGTYNFIPVDLSGTAWKCLLSRVHSTRLHSLSRLAQQFASIHRQQLELIQPLSSTLKFSVFERNLMLVRNLKGQYYRRKLETFFRKKTKQKKDWYGVPRQHHPRLFWPYSVAHWPQW